MTIDSSINVSASQGVQIGGAGNVQNVSIDIEKMMSMIDSASGTITEKEEAKSLLKILVENKIIRGVLGALLKVWSGG